MNEVDEKGIMAKCWRKCKNLLFILEYLSKDRHTSDVVYFVLKLNRMKGNGSGGCVCVFTYFFIFYCSFGFANKHF